MAPKDSNDCVVTVTIELGHQANFLKEPSPEGFTHDWTVFVRGYEGSRLEYFVEKVVFKLHKTFKCPLRVISEPPFKVTESGYAGFILPIEIHFKNKQTPRKFVFQYDLFLNAKDSPPINNVRYEKLKFQNPTPEFKAKLIKAGGIEQGSESVPYAKPDLFGSPVQTEKKKISKPPKEKDKKKVKKRKSSPPGKSASPAPSLSSLSPDEDDEDDYTPPPPPPPPKKEKETLKKEGSSSSSSSHLKQESSSSSSHKEKSKHRSISTSSVHKDRPSSEKEVPHKSHKHKSKDKDRDKSGSHKDKENVRKEKELGSQKSAKETPESRKDREGSHSSNKSSSSSHGEKKYSSLTGVSKEKEKSSSSKEKDSSGSSHKEKHSSSIKDKEKSSSKDKHSSHKDTGQSASEAKKDREDVSKEKKEKKHSDKSHKRPSESPLVDEETEKKKLKRSPSVVSIDERSFKSKSSSGKEKNSSRDSKEKLSPIESKDKDLKSSSSSGKTKSEKSKHSEKQRHNHPPESKQKDSKKTDLPQKPEKSSKSEALTKSERLAMTADFQPQLLLSPLKSPPEEGPALSPPPAEKAIIKRSASSSSVGSLSSASGSDVADKSDNEMQESQAEEAKHIVSGLTDSDSDSDEEAPPATSPQKELKTVLNKQAHLVQKSKSFSGDLPARKVSHEEKVKRKDYESATEETPKKSESFSKQSKEVKKAAKRGEVKKNKPKHADPKPGSSDDEVIVDNVNEDTTLSSHNIEGLDISAPNGIPIGELIAINEKIEKAQEEANQEVLDKVIEIIGETDDFDLDDSSLFFDICSVEKNVVLQIQAALRDY